MSKLLHMASDEFSNHGCNDFELPATPENLALVKQAEESEDEPHIQDGAIITNDWVLMDHLRKRCEEEASRL